MTIVVGGVLALANQLLKDEQKKSIELDTKTSILSAVSTIDKSTDVLGMYDNRIRSLVVDINGEEVTKNEEGTPVVAENIDVAKQYKVDYRERLYPVFKYMNAEDTAKVDAYIFPVYGAGLWDKIWGFVALESDLNTITGTSFSHKSETPGLGARIDSPEIQGRFIGKKIYEDNGRFVSVTMVKGEAGGGGEGSKQAFADNPHQVDGMSGATLTANGLNVMIKSYLDSYQKYFDKLK